jgi:hypothetical protein
LVLRAKKAIATGGRAGSAARSASFWGEGCDVALCTRGEAGVEEAVTALAGTRVGAYGAAERVTRNLSP